VGECVIVQPSKSPCTPQKLAIIQPLHTIDAGQTINRIVGMFDQAEEQLIRNRLATMLRWVVAQRLLPKIGGGRLAVLEIMRSNLRVQEAIMHGESEGKTFYEMIDAGVAMGMQTFDKSILQGYEEGLITEQTAMVCVTAVDRGAASIRSKMPGEKTTDRKDSLDNEYDRQFSRKRTALNYAHRLSSLSKRLQIADDKIPGDRQVRLSCPACQNVFFTIRGHKRAPEVRRLRLSPLLPAPATSRATASMNTGNLRHCRSWSSPRVPSVWIMRPTAKRVRDDAAWDVAPYIPSHQAQAAYLSQVPYECFISTRRSMAPETNPILACLHELPMERRRHICHLCAARHYHCQMP
jgi:hypothetical protein